MNLLFLQPAAHVAELGIDLSRFGHTARFGVVNLAALPRRLGKVDAVINCIDTSTTARRVLDAAIRAEVPRVYVFDGIYDVANAYRNPLHRRRGINQMDPLLYTHMACVDRWSFATFAALGAQTHAWLPKRAEPERGSSPVSTNATFLVATARNPAFDPGERVRLTRLLTLTMQSLDRIGATYRFRTGDTELLTSLGIPHERNDTGASFARCIRSYDCLITTPSTIATTAMLAGKPTATLDYRDAPLTQQTGWRLHESTDIDSTLTAMLEPAADRMAFQVREVAHLAERSPVEDFILSAAATRSAADLQRARPRFREAISFEHPLRWLYVNGLKRFRKRL